MYGYNPQTLDIDKQIQEEKSRLSELERKKIQAMYAQPTILNQTIQAGPQTNSYKNAESIDDVNREMVFLDTIFVNKTFTNMWLKTPQGKVKTYLLEEIIPKDEKDLRIESLEKQIKELLEGKKEDANKHTGNNAAITGSVSESISATTTNENE